jgi:hypothetical protein
LVYVGFPAALEIRISIRARPRTTPTSRVVQPSPTTLRADRARIASRVATSPLTRVNAAKVTAASVNGLAITMISRQSSAAPPAASPDASRTSARAVLAFEYLSPTQ